MSNIVIPLLPQGSMWAHWLLQEVEECLQWLAANKELEGIQKEDFCITSNPLNISSRKKRDTNTRWNIENKSDTNIYRIYKEYTNWRRGELSWCYGELVLWRGGIESLVFTGKCKNRNEFCFSYEAGIWAISGNLGIEWILNLYEQYPETLTETQRKTLAAASAKRRYLKTGNIVGANLSRLEILKATWETVECPISALLDVVWSIKTPEGTEWSLGKIDDVFWNEFEAPRPSVLGDSLENIVLKTALGCCVFHIRHLKGDNVNRFYSSWSMKVDFEDYGNELFLKLVGKFGMPSSLESDEEGRKEYDG